MIVLRLGIMSTQPDTKIVIVVRDDLATWQKLNLTAFVSSGIANSAPESVGEAYQDADGTKYTPMFGQPVMVFATDAGGLRRTLDRALARSMVPAIYTEELFTTGNDIDNRAAVAVVAQADLNLVGIAVRGLRRDVDKVTKGLTLHR